MNEIDKESERLEKKIVEKKRIKLSFKDWVFIFFVVAITFAMVFVTFYKFIKIDVKDCQSYPYQQVEHNSSIKINVTSWKSNITIPNNSKLCLGEKILTYFVDNISNLTYAKQECNGTFLTNETFNVSCSSGYFYTDKYNPKNYSAMTICRVLYNCTLSEEWRWKANKKAT